jgi:outer membrane protein TolC
MAMVIAGDCSGAGLTLRECIDEAYGLSPALKAEQLDIDAAGEEIIRQRTALLPSVNASLMAGVIDGYPVSPFAIVTGEDIENGPVGGSTRQLETKTERTTLTSGGKIFTGNTTTTEEVQSENQPRELRRADFAPLSTEHIELDYPLFQNGSILGLNDAPAVAAARAAKRELEWTKKEVEEKVVFDICNAYFIAQWYQQKLARDEARVYFSRQRLDIVQLQFKLQLMLAQDVELARTSLKADEETLEATKQSVRDSYAVLAVKIGEPTGRVAKLEGKAPAFPELPELDGLLKAAQVLHPAIGGQEAAAEQSEEAYRLEKAQLLPAANFNTGYTVGQNLGHVSSASTDLPTLYTAGITVNVPVFDWGSRLAAEREARGKAGAAEALIAEAKMDVSTAIAKLYDTIHDLERQLAGAGEAEMTAENAAKLAREQRATGALNQLAVVTAEQTLLAAQETVETTRLTELEAYTQLDQAAGGAWRWGR